MFYNRDYDVYVLLGNPEIPPLWRWTEWSHAVTFLTPLIEGARGKPAARCLQLSPEKKGRQIPFGQLAWNDRSHEKWTHNSPSNIELSSNWYFCDLEVWSPIWTVCEREDTAPDVFLYVGNQARVGGESNRKLAFNPLILLAVSIDLTMEVRSAGKKAALKLAFLTQAKLAAIKRRPWGYSFGDGTGFTGAINDMGTIGLFKLGDVHSRPVDLNTFDERFELLEPLKPQ